LIRIEFSNIARGPWSFEMSMNHAITKTLREHGVPIAARLAFAGVERGSLSMTHAAESNKITFVYREPGEHPDEARSVPERKTHEGGGYSVHLAGRHLAKHEEDDEL
jgi:hypothetical protein